MVVLLTELGLDRSDRGPFVLLRQLREKAVKRGNAGLRVVADGRDEWVGWVEAKMAPVNERAIDNLARVVCDVNADILAVVEAENRVALKAFSEDVLPRVGGRPYSCVMVIDGNDRRGIDVGVLTRDGFSIGDMRSHFHDLNDAGRPIFSRDCPEYAITTPAGERIWILPNHLKSKFGGNSPTSRARRRAQATRVAEVYGALRASNEDLVAVVGDFNDVPEAAELTPLIGATDLIDAQNVPDFDVPLNDPTRAPRNGTFSSGLPSARIDYILLSPALFARATGGGLFRKGAWPGVQPRLWDVFPGLTHKVHVASDHHVVYVDID